MNARTLASFELALAGAAMLGLSVHGALAADRAPIVSTADGWLRGLPRTGGGAEFRGIPYAEPPVGRLRWRAPVPAKRWRGVRSAATFGARCAQPLPSGWKESFAAYSSEDCLYLNVIVPRWPVRKPLPVMFWIHGGSHVSGTGTDAIFTTGTLADDGVVLVTIDYRLGVFGFLAAPALSRESPHHASGNYGLMDQVLALQWVRANIARFGGDPRNITVFGQSSGGMDVGLLMASSARHLFQKAIQESGAPFNWPAKTLAQAEQAGARLVAAMGALPGAAGLALLRTVPPDGILAKLAAVPPDRREFPSPDVDGWVIPSEPTRAFEAGRESPIPLMIGTTQRENVVPLRGSLEGLRLAIRRYAGPLAPQFLAVYGFAHGGQGFSDPKYGTATNQLFADANFRCPTVLEARWHADAGHLVYQYEFDHPIPGHHPYAVHGAEVPYVFGYLPTDEGVLEATFGTPTRFTATDRRISQLMMRYWTNFAKTGNPNAPGLPDWPQFGHEGSYIQVLESGNVAPAHDLRHAQCALARKWLLAQMRPTPR